MRSSSPQPGTAQWGCSPLSRRLGVQLWGQAASGCSGLSTSRPWSDRPLTAPIPISSGERTGRQHPGGAATPCCSSRGGWLPGHRTPHGLCISVRGPCGAGLRAGLSWICRHAWPCSPQASREQGWPAPLSESIVGQPQAPGRQAGERQLSNRLGGPLARSPVGGGFPGGPELRSC